MPSGRDSFRRNRVAPFVLFYFIMQAARCVARATFRAEREQPARDSTL